MLWETSGWRQGTQPTTIFRPQGPSFWRMRAVVVAVLEEVVAMVWLRIRASAAGRTRLCAAHADRVNACAVSVLRRASYVRIASQAAVATSE